MILGFDIGGTKCAVVTAAWDGSEISITEKRKIPTDLTVSPYEMIQKLISLADEICTETPEKIGISCGGPLDSQKGVIMSPPNLPGWDNVEIVKQIELHYGVKPVLQNDANACAVAEWKFGAGKGAKNMVFLTFGTGLGAGLILNGALYSGTNDNAGEVGHISLRKDGPVGYGKAGSFEGFCSGGGLSQLGYSVALEKISQGKDVMYYKKGQDKSEVTAAEIARCAALGDEAALEVMKTCGEMLGEGLSVLIDILNPERIIIGSIYARNEELLKGFAEKVIDKQALSCSKNCCRILPAALGESIGDYASVATALLSD